MINLVLPFPPTVNTYWRKWNNRMVISEKGRAYRNAVADSLLEGRAYFYHLTLDKKLRVEIKAYRPDKRKRDLDNLLKATLDSLAYAGVYQDDSQIVDLHIYWANEIGGMLKIKIEEINEK
jgi:crossover junction endodeoxyribonuclease RusA